MRRTSSSVARVLLALLTLLATALPPVSALAHEVVHGRAANGSETPQVTAEARAVPRAPSLRALCPLPDHRSSCPSHGRRGGQRVGPLAAAERHAGLSALVTARPPERIGADGGRAMDLGASADRSRAPPRR